MGGRINFTTHWGGKKPKQQNTHREALQATETLQQAAPWNKSILSALLPSGDTEELPSSKGCHLPN